MIQTFMKRKKNKSKELRKREEALRKGIYVKTKLPVDFEKLSEKSLRSWTIPEFYEDQIYNCVECGRECIFTAEEQKRKFEEEKKYIWQRPNRCREHFQLWRESRKAKFEMDRALEQLKQNPEDKKLLISYAESIVKFHQKNERGNLQIAMSIFKRFEVKDNYSHYCKETIKNS